MRRPGFTLIELLITVAIIAILAAIALPNFLAAQTRAKVARALNDLRALEGALVTYTLDHNAPPPSSGVGVFHNPTHFSHPVSQRLITLTTPVAYLTSVPQDPFVPRESLLSQIDTSNPYDTYDYVDVPTSWGLGSEISSGSRWRIMSSGPDLLFAAGGLDAHPFNDLVNEAGVDYDATNGSLSAGEIVRVSGQGVATANGGDPADLGNPERPGILRVPSYREQYD